VLGATVLRVVALLAPVAASAESAPTLEYQVKASYIYNLIQFIQWPADSIGDEFQICVFGEHRFGDALDALEGNRLAGRPLKVRYLGDVREANTCHVLYFTEALAHRTPSLLGAASAPGLLTIGETREFTAQGGVIGLIKVGGKVKFEINEAAAQSAGLTISAQLLRLAIRR
jgi:hypothetical protein